MGGSRGRVRLANVQVLHTAAAAGRSFGGGARGGSRGALGHDGRWRCRKTTKEAAGLSRRSTAAAAFRSFGGGCTRRLSGAFGRLEDGAVKAALDIQALATAAAMRGVSATTRAAALGALEAWRSAAGGS